MGMNGEEYGKRIMALSMLAEMPPASREKVARLLLENGTADTLEDGAMLIRRDGLGGDTGYILLDGRVRIKRDGGEAVTLGAPAVLGEMHQLNPGAQRTADVIAEGAGAALKFSWRMLYAAAGKTLSLEEQQRLMSAVERLVLQRFHEEDLLDLPMLRKLPDHLRLRICLVLHWVSKPFELAPGEHLFTEQAMCSDTGYLLTRGTLQLTMSGQKAGQLEAPDIAGIMLRFAPDMRWTATAAAETPAEGKRFAWLVLRNALEERLLPDELHQFDHALAVWAENHFMH
jgi:hypothetical protein